MNEATNREHYDVAILGSGIAGSMLAAILAKHDLRVLLLERSSHPRFAIGESLLPQSTLLFMIMGEKYGIPEIGHLADWAKVNAHVSKRCGQKRGVGFVYHSEGQPHDSDRCHLFIAPPFITAESHLYREDVDLYMVNAAVTYGVDFRDHVNVTDIEFHDDHVDIEANTGRFRVKYLVDGTGQGSLVANKLGLRVSPSELKTNSRSVFTHMRGVSPYASCVEQSWKPGLTADWHQGTMHHLFEGGWIWVIPFDNHAATDNPRCSVGMSLDCARHPRRTGESPEQEFRRIISKYPAIVAHFAHAEADRDWISTGRLQYGSRKATGKRFCLLAHSYGFIDALYSRGMVSSADVVNSLAHRLLGAFAKNHFPEAGFPYIDQLQASALASNDRLVHGSYVSFSDFDMWNAWFRLWMISQSFGDMRLIRAWVKYLESREPAHLAALEDDHAPGTACASIGEVQRILDRGSAIADRVQSGELSTADGSARIFALFEEVAELLPPLYDWTNPNARHLEASAKEIARMFLWGVSAAPNKVRVNLYDFNPAPLIERSLPPGRAKVIGAGFALLGRMCRGGGKDGDLRLEQAALRSS